MGAHHIRYGTQPPPPPHQPLPAPFKECPSHLPGYSRRLHLHAARTCRASKAAGGAAPGLRSRPVLQSLRCLCRQRGPRQQQWQVLRNLSSEKNICSKQQRPEPSGSGRCLTLIRQAGSETDPNPAAPIATAGMLAPYIVLTRAPGPVIGVHDHAIAGGIPVRVTHMPALAFTITYDCRGRGSSRGDHGGKPQKRYSDQLTGLLHRHTSQNSQTSNALRPEWFTGPVIYHGRRGLGPRPNVKAAPSRRAMPNRSVRGARRRRATWKKDHRFSMHSAETRLISTSRLTRLL